MADRGQKKQKDPSRKAMAGRAKDERRATNVSEVLWEKYTSGRLPEANVRAGLQLGVVEGVKGGSRFSVRGLVDGQLFEGVTIKASVKVGSHKRAAESAAFIGVGTYVLTDGDTISAKIQTNDARRYLASKGAAGAAASPPASRSGSRSSRGTRRSGSSRGTRRSGSGSASSSASSHGNAPEGFAWNIANKRGPGALARLATRKAGHAKGKRIQKEIRAAQGAAFVPNLFAPARNEGRVVLVEAAAPRSERAPHVERFGYRGSRANANQAVVNFFRARMEGAAASNE